MILFTVFFSATGCFLLPNEEEELPPPALIKPAERTYELFPVVRDTIRDEITGPAVFVPRLLVDHYFVESGGLVKRLFIALGDSVREGDVLAELHTGDFPDRIELQELSIRKLEIQLDVKKKVNTARHEVELAEIDLEIEKKRLRMLKTQLSNSLLRATVDGVVVFLDRSYSPGNNIPAFRPLVRIADPSELELRYNGSRWNEFVVGSKVEVRFRDIIYEGSVIQAPGNAPAGSSDELRNAVFIKLGKLPPGVSSGELAQITLVLDERQNVLVIPRDSVREYLGRRYVYVYEDGLRKERTIETGIESGLLVEVTEGIEEGQLVILR